jgi:putative membrane protein (TIGR04086 family)
MRAKVGNKRRPEHTANKSVFGRAALISLSGMALLTGLLFLAAAICLHRDASGWMLPAAAYLCCAASAFPVGCFAAKAVGKSGLLCGLLCALPLCILLLILSIALHGTVGTGFLIGCALLLFFGASGGVTVLNLRRKRRYR